MATGYICICASRHGNRTWLSCAIMHVCCVHVCSKYEHRCWLKAVIFLRLRLENPCSLSLFLDVSVISFFSFNSQSSNTRIGQEKGRVWRGNVHCSFPKCLYCSSQLLSQLAPSCNEDLRSLQIITIMLWILYIRISFSKELNGLFFLDCSHYRFFLRITVEYFYQQRLLGEKSPVFLNCEGGGCISLCVCSG